MTNENVFVKEGGMGLAQYICQVCDKNFKSYNVNAKYCSQMCKGKAYIKYPIRKCEVCNRAYKPRNATNKYCSMDCSRKSRTNKEPMLNS